MTRDFDKLLEWTEILSAHSSSILQRGLLKDNLIAGGLTDSMSICSGQELMILIHVLRGHTNRETAERWQHSSATISKNVQEVSICLNNVKDRLYKPAKVGDPIPAKISYTGNFTPYFDNSIGAID